MLMYESLMIVVPLKKILKSRITALCIQVSSQQNQIIDNDQSEQR